MQAGMPISIALQLEAVFPAVVARNYAGLIRSITLEEERPGPLGGTTQVARKPVGVIAAIVPWNYPQTAAVHLPASSDRRLR
jgi:aldehyde dehydrogenase (NAD+)